MDIISHFALVHFVFPPSLFFPKYLLLNPAPTRWLELLSLLHLIRAPSFPHPLLESTLHSSPPHPSFHPSFHPDCGPGDPVVPATFPSTSISMVIWSAIGCESSLTSIAVIVFRPSSRSCRVCHFCSLYPCCHPACRLSCDHDDHPLASRPATYPSSIFCDPRTCCGNAISISNVLGIHCGCGCVVVHAIWISTSMTNIFSISCAATTNSSFCPSIFWISTSSAIAMDSESQQSDLCFLIFLFVFSVGHWTKIGNGIYEVQGAVSTLSRIRR